MKVALGIAGAVFVASAIGDPPPRRFDFRHDILPFLQREGCASAYCHGGGTGQAGFKLSLFGGDAMADYGALVVDLGGRRIDRDNPADSLVLQKGLGRLEHGGGRVLARDGAAHRALLAWIAAGAPWQQAGGRELSRIELDVAGDQLLVRASYEGQGDRVEDVSDRVLFSSSNPLIVEVSAAGRLLRKGPGVAYAIARFGNHTARLQLASRFAADAVATAGSSHPLDVAWSKQLQQIGLSPAAPASPDQLARRLFLDLLGRPPTPAELDRFVAQPDVAATAADLVRRREFAAVWADLIAGWLEVAPDNVVVRSRIAAALRARRSLREIAAQVASGELPLVESRADPRDRAEYVGRALLGLRIGCARCHDHPGDRWRRDEYEAFSAAFAAPRGAARGMAVGQVFDAETGEAVAPRWLPLPGLGVPLQPAQRAGLAEFVLDRGHGRLARHFGNHLFAELFGAGLVEPRDDHRDGNPARSELLLAAIAAEFERVDGDLVALLTSLVTSRLYALAMVSADDVRSSWFAARRATQLSSTAYERAIAAVVGRDPRGVLPGEPLARELALRNGAYLRELLDGGGTTIDALFDFGGTPQERLDELWRTLLSRSPRDAEMREFTPLASAGYAAFRELAMAVLTGREFGQRR